MELFNLKAHLMSERNGLSQQGTFYVYRESPEMPSATWMQDWMMTLVYAMEEQQASLLLLVMVSLWRNTWSPTVRC